MVDLAGLFEFLQAVFDFLDWFGAVFGWLF
jgi:hypothetical protein